jgi:uncharacterized protein GlcG (DUF336 family)
LAAQQHDRSKTKENSMNREITLEVAETMIQAAKKKSEELKIKEDIAVVDASGNLKAFVRMDGAWLGSIDIAIRKARTARYFDMETAEIGKMSQPGQPLYGVELSNGGLISFGGGIPVKDSDGTVIGAVGVSGSSVENDVEVAKAAVEAGKGRKSAIA